jgi:hypothetical protein
LQGLTAHFEGISGKRHRGNAKRIDEASIHRSRSPLSIGNSTSLDPSWKPPGSPMLISMLTLIGWEFVAVLILRRQINIHAELGLNWMCVI